MGARGAWGGVLVVGSWGIGIGIGIEIGIGRWVMVMGDRMGRLEKGEGGGRGLWLDRLCRRL